jgi:hypothetical protein
VTLHTWFVPDPDESSRIDRQTARPELTAMWGMAIAAAWPGRRARPALVPIGWGEIASAEGRQPLANRVSLAVTQDLATLMALVARKGWGCSRTLIVRLDPAAALTAGMMRLRVTLPPGRRHVVGHPCAGLDRAGLHSPLPCPART